MSPTAPPAIDDDRDTLAAATLYCYTISAVDAAGNESAQSPIRNV